MLSRLTRAIRASRLWALVLKEFRQTLRNKLLLYLLLVPPTVQLILLGASLDPELHHLRLGITDQSRSATSRQFKDLLTAAGTFTLAAECNTQKELSDLLETGKISAAIVIPKDFDKSLATNKSASVQTLVDGADAYTAKVASAYLKETMSQFHPPVLLPEKATLIASQTRILYNPGLVASWYLVPGVLGATLTLIGTLVSSAVLLREKELGTLEQLLMTPASEFEIILAKIIPLFVMLISDVAIALFLCQLIFGLPFRGNPIVFFTGAAMYICICIGSGMFLGTWCRSQRQAQLCSFFINIPLIQLSGSVVPFESMPVFLQYLSTFDPLRYFTFFARASLLKGAGLELLWPYLAVLFFAATLILTASTLRFRRQMG